jgi:MHS family proline/betaine transporter-like MFS transporter
MNRKSIKKGISVLLGTVVEYYDYSLYGFCPLILAKHFLPTSDPIVALITTYGVYAIGSLSKPLGALIFGWIGDNLGRKASLNITLLGIAAPTTLIGLLPGYAYIGFLASLVLVICRFLQGIFVAGEYDGAALYIIEHSQNRGQNFSSALIRFTGVIGLLLGSTMVMICTSSYFPEWFWRVPFLLSFPLGLLSIYLRRTLVETPEFLRHLENRNPIRIPFIHVLKKGWKDILTIILLCGTFGGTYHIGIIFFNSFLPMALPNYSFSMDWVNPTVILVFGLSMLISGLIADKKGTSVVIRWGLLIACLSGIGMGYSLMKASVAGVIVFHYLLAIGIAPFNSLAHALMYQLFSVNSRYRCISIGHTIGSMALSGTAPILCGALWKVSNLAYAPFLYLTALLILGSIATTLCEKRRRKLAAIQAPALAMAA